MVIVALRKVFKYSFGYSRLNLFRKRENHVQHSGRIVLGVFCLKIWNTGIMTLTGKIEEKRKIKKIKKSIIPLPNTTTPTLNVADAVEPRVCVNVKNQ